NQPFKRIDITMRAFAAFARDKPPDVRLYLHMATAPAAPGTLPLADALGIRDRLLVSAVGPHHPNVSNEQMNAIYNACDVGVNTSEGEGWGLVSVEHAATGAAQIVPRHSACAEIWDGAAFVVDPVAEDRVEGYCTAGCTVSVSAVTNAFQQLFDNRGRRRDLSHAAYCRTMRDDWRWSSISDEWDRLFSRLLSPSRRHR